MRYQNIHKAVFVSRPNRFIAYVRLGQELLKVHVKNTGRCKELLTEGAAVYLEKASGEAMLSRSTAYDLVAVKKGDVLVNMDSYAPNLAVKEWLEAGKLDKNVSLVRPETTFGDSRFDFYMETHDGRKCFIEVKGVTLENDHVASFPDAPSDRAVKHIEELIQARKAGYEAFLLFVVQMDGIQYVIPNRETHPAFGDALEKARKEGVHIVAYDTLVTEWEMTIRNRLPVFVNTLEQIPDKMLAWYDKGRRILPWRESPTPYHVWLSEIMLQQTRVEAVKPYYDRFLKALPDINSLATADEETLLKLWEGLGYYNRVRNLQKAAIQIIEEYHGEMPDTVEELLKLPGIGSYTAGAIASIAYGKKAPAVDGNVLRVLSRVLLDDRNILDAKVKKAYEDDLYVFMSDTRPGDFNQSMMELGAMVCLPNGQPKCDICPLRDICGAKRENCAMKYPVKVAKKARKIEEKTVLILQDNNKAALCRRPEKGLLAGLYEFPCMDGWQNQKQVLAYLKALGFSSIRIKKLEDAKHIFTHKEWHMVGYAIAVDELSMVDEVTKKIGWQFIEKDEIQEKYPIPSAYATYTKYLEIKQGAEVFT